MEDYQALLHQSQAILRTETAGLDELADYLRCTATGHAANPSGSAVVSALFDVEGAEGPDSSAVLDRGDARAMFRQPIGSVLQRSIETGQVRSDIGVEAAVEYVEAMLKALCRLAVADDGIDRLEAPLRYGLAALAPTERSPG